MRHYGQRTATIGPTTSYRGESYRPAGPRGKAYLAMRRISRPTLSLATAGSQNPS